tara:strand:- start:483 stop:776 length:294 start_codon:yes stop_codon:yes gene_type:complete
MTARYPLVIAGTTIEEIQVGDTYNLDQGTSLPLATGVTGVLPVANGGTNLASYTANGVLFASSTSVLAQSANLAFNSSTSVLTIGTGTTGGISGGTF